MYVVWCLQEAPGNVPPAWFLHYVCTHGVPPPPGYVPPERGVHDGGEGEDAWEEGDGERVQRMGPVADGSQEEYEQDEEAGTWEAAWAEDVYAFMSRQPGGREGQTMMIKELSAHVPAPAPLRSLRDQRALLESDPRFSVTQVGKTAADANRRSVPIFAVSLVGGLAAMPAACATATVHSLRDSRDGQYEVEEGRGVTGSVSALALAANGGLKRCGLHGKFRKVGFMEETMTPSGEKRWQCLPQFQCPAAAVKEGGGAAAVGRGGSLVIQATFDDQGAAGAECPFVSKLGPALPGPELGASLVSLDRASPRGKEGQKVSKDGQKASGMLLPVLRRSSGGGADVMELEDVGRRGCLDARGEAKKSEGAGRGKLEEERAHWERASSSDGVGNDRGRQAGRGEGAGREGGGAWSREGSPGVSRGRAGGGERRYDRDSPCGRGGDIQPSFVRGRSREREWERERAREGEWEREQERERERRGVGGREGDEVN